MSILFKLSEKGLSSKWWSFLRFGMLSKSMHQIAQIRFENCKVFIASEGAHPPQTPPFQTRKICKVLLIYYIQTIPEWAASRLVVLSVGFRSPRSWVSSNNILHVSSITQETLGLLKFECHFWTFSDNLLPDNQISFQNIDNFEIVLTTCSILGYRCSMQFPIRRSKIFSTQWAVSYHIIKIFLYHWCRLI